MTRFRPSASGSSFAIGMLLTARKFCGTRHGQRERRLEGRLVPAGKNPPRIRGLELGRDHPLAAGLGRIIGKEQAAAERIDLRGEGEAKLVRPLRQRRRKGQRRGLGAWIERDLGALRAVVDACLRES